MQQSMIPRNSQGFHQQEFRLHSKKEYVKFLNWNGQGTDVMNELVTQ